MSEHITENKSAQKISIDNAKQNKLFYFVANVIVYRESDKRCLILKRSESEIAHPGKYCVPGGKLEWKDLDVQNPTRLNGNILDYENAIEKLLARETREEAGVEIEDEFKYINSVAYIRPDETPTVMIKLTVKYKSGEVLLEDGSFSDFAWVNKDEIDNYECIKGIREEIKLAIELFEK